MEKIKLFLPSFLYQDGKFLKNHCVAVKSGTIIGVGGAETLARQYTDAEAVKMPDTILLPGTVNVHNHSFQSLLRGIAVDRPFLEWRDNSLYRYSQRLSPDDLYAGALFAFGEMMRCGVTTVSDFFYVHNDGPESDEAIIRAAGDLGIRLVLARTMYDWDGAPSGYCETIEKAYDNVLNLAQKYNGDESENVKIVPAPHSLHAASIEMVKAGHELAKKLGTRFHIHVAEEPFEVEQVKKEHYGLTPVELLDKIGVVDSSMVIIHGVWLKGSEIELLGERGSKLAYCPSSNMFLADGVTDLVKFLKSKVTIGLGSDGACSNNRNSIFEEMRMAALLQKVSKLDAMSVNYQDAFKMGTEWGGEVLGLPVGRIEEGYKADFTGVDLNDLSLQPISESGEQMLPNIVYGMQPTAVKYVIVGGNLTVCGGKIQTVPEKKIIEAVKKVTKDW